MIAIALALGLAAQLPPSLGQGLAGWWKLDEAAGPSADASGNGLGGTWTGGVSAGGQFDGESGVISVPDSPTLHFTGAFSISFWMNPAHEAGDWQRLVGKGGSTGSRDYGVWLEAAPSNRLLFQSWGDNVFLNMFGNASIPSGTWTHVACVYDGSSATIYVNGGVDATTFISGAIDSSGDPLTFGYGNMHTYFPGRLDEIRLYSRALTTSEITALASTQGSSGDPTPVPSGSPAPTVEDESSDGKAPQPGPCGLAAAGTTGPIALLLCLAVRRNR